MLYFDHSATSYPKPECVKKAVYDSFDAYGNAGRGTYELSLRTSRFVYATREYIKSFFHTSNKAQVVFTSGATESLNIVLKGMLTKGDHVITTILEHNSVLRPLYDLQEKGVELSFLPCDKQGNLRIEQLDAILQENTKILVCTHASNVTGNINPLKAISEICHRHGIIFVVDAAQSVGHYAFSMQEEGIDILCFCGHKGLLSPCGIGGIVLKQDYPIRPILSGGTGFDSFSKHQPTALPEHLEAGTLPIQAIAGLYAGMKYVQKVGIDKIHSYENMLATAFYTQLIKLPGVHVIGTGKSCAIVSFYIDGRTSDEVADILGYEYGIAVRGGSHCAPLLHEHFHTKEIGIVRFSFGYENTIEEVHTAIHALQEIIGEQL